MKDNLDIFVMMLFPFTVVGILFLLLYEDGVPFSMYNKIRCRWLKKHKFITTFGKIPKYYCLACGVPREHPKLKLIVGGKVLDHKRKRRR